MKMRMIRNDNDDASNRFNIPKRANSEAYNPSLSFNGRSFISNNEMKSRYSSRISTAMVRDQSTATG